MSNEPTHDNILVLKDKVDDALAIPAVNVGPANEQPDEQEAQVWAFQGVHGGSGVTSLVVQTAYELANMHKRIDGSDLQVLLIDLDFERGGCAVYLDIQPSLRVDELNAASGRMDEELANTFIRKYSKNISTIIPEGELGGNDLLNPHALLSLLDKISTQFDYIILDLPQLWRSWTQAIIGASDKFSLVTALSVPSLHKTKELSKAITVAMNFEEPPHILVNKFERRSLRHGVNLKDAMQVLDRDDLIKICTDEDTVRQAINSGQPVGKFKSDSRYAKAVREYVSAWVIEVENSIRLGNSAVQDVAKQA